MGMLNFVPNAAKKVRDKETFVLSKKGHFSAKCPFVFYSFIGKISFSLSTRGVILTAWWQLPSETISLETPL